MKKLTIFILPFLLLLALAALLIVTQYQARENDSRLYTSELVDISQGPLTSVIAPKWRADANNYQFDPTVPYIQDHPMGNLLPGLVLVKLGFPSYAALYFVNLLYKLAIIFLLYLIGRRYYPEEKASFILLGGQILVASISYQLRSNHEQLLLLAVVWMYYSLLVLKNSWAKALGVGLGFSVLLLTKGVFALLGGFVLLSDLFVIKRTWKERFFIYSFGLLSLFATAGLYEFWYQKVTGLSFIGPYWKIQIAARTLQEAPVPLLLKLFTKLKNFWDYFLRTFVGALPWSLLFLGALGFSRKFRSSFKMDELSKLLLLYAFFQISFFSLSDRFASRYVYQSFVLAGAFFAFQIYDLSPRFQEIYKRYFYPQRINYTFILFFLLCALSLGIHEWRYPQF